MAVGADVGVGARVGVGAVVGVGVGARVGAAVGVGDGAIVGTAVGAGAAVAVGSAVAVGAIVGASVDARSPQAAPRITTSSSKPAAQYRINSLNLIGKICQERHDAPIYPRPRRKSRNPLPSAAANIVE